MAQKDVLAEIKKAVKAMRTERGETGAVAKILAAHGYFDPPVIVTGKFGKGAAVRIYRYDGTPAGDFALVTGPSVEGEVHAMADLNVMEAPEGFYVEMVPDSSSAAKQAKAQAARAASLAKQAGVKKAPAKPKRKAPAKKRAAPRKAAPPAPVPVPLPTPAPAPAPAAMDDAAMMAMFAAALDKALASQPV